MTYLALSISFSPRSDMFVSKDPVTHIVAIIKIFYCDCEKFSPFIYKLPLKHIAYRYKLEERALERNYEEKISIQKNWRILKEKRSF